MDRRLSRERRSVSNDRRLTMAAERVHLSKQSKRVTNFGSQPVLSTKSSSTKFDVVIEEPSVLNSSRLISLGKPDHQTVSLPSQPTVNFDKTLSTLLASDELTRQVPSASLKQKILWQIGSAVGAVSSYSADFAQFGIAGGAALVAMATIVGANRSSANFDNDSIR
ncbi:hypothetical protein BOX15_Mlig000613g4 [Macrostomum lignano]|uniref:Uncharacterized protein n=1 Tax=Macrostomum lignano TaxID=282301 RepID=A0A267DS74_9PLAT|nr:hypothetical protein BOX15_Mlig000613g4 [Macrostomum lignano]